MDLVLLKRYDMAPEAELIATMLRQSGVRCVVQKEGVPGSMGLLQGAEVYVSPDDLVRANDLLQR